tara:strand:- start:228 stop:1721 length:1494 start_codon:yes stop_codon:yes gene_type:complete
MGKGGKRFKDSKWIQDITDLKVPNWVNEYSMFRSPSGAFDIGTVRKEYKEALDQWLKGGGEDLNDFRNKHGIIIDEKGNELLSSDWSGERRRFIRDKQQTHSGKGGKAEGKQVPKEPWWNAMVDQDGKPVLNSKGKPIKYTKLEGHHIVGLAHLGPFFEGATDQQAFELRQRILNETKRGAVGTDKRNWAWLTNKQHDLAHKLYGYASDAEIADPKNKGTVFYDLEQPGKKGTPNFSDKFLNKLANAPFDREGWQTDLLGKNVPAKNIEGLNVTKGDYLIEYLNLTDEAYEDSILRARKMEPHPIKLTEVSPDLAETSGKGLFNINPKSGNALIDSLNLDKLSGKTRTADLVAQTGMNVASGNVIGAGISGGTLLASEAMKSPAAQKAIAKQVSKLIAERGAKTAAKLVPGLDIALSGKEAWDYASQGKWDQAGLAALSGAVGWIPVIGDGASAALDLTNTGIDISRLDYNQQADAKKKKTKFNEPDINSRAFKALL